MPGFDRLWCLLEAGLGIRVLCFVHIGSMTVPRPCPAEPCCPPHPALLGMSDALFCNTFLPHPPSPPPPTGFQHFDMIHFGSYLSALSPFWLVIWPAEWAAAMFVLTLSLGEAVWSPRWYDYSMGVAPDGKEGMFTALASAPLFAAMLPTGTGGWGLEWLWRRWLIVCCPQDRAHPMATDFPAEASHSSAPGPSLMPLPPPAHNSRPGMLSGYLLDRFCPDNGQCSDVSAGRSLLAHAQATAPSPSPGGGECRGPIMWTTVALLTLTSPLLILVTQVGVL